MTDEDRRRQWEIEMEAAREAWVDVGERWGGVISLLFLLIALLLMPGCAYLDAAHALKEEGKARAAILNDHYAADVAALARTVPAGALARMPSGTQKCALAALSGLALIECQFVAVPGWAGQ